MCDPKDEILTPIQAGELYHQQLEGGKKFRFRIYCPNCDGWVFWDPPLCCCPRCHLTNSEAMSLSKGCRAYETARQEEGEEPDHAP